MVNKMRFKIYALFLVMAVFISGSPLFANGALDTGPATTYQVTLSQFQIDNGVGSTAVTATSTSATLDIASAADTNTSVGNFMSGFTVPDGSYSRVKPTPSGAFTITGSVLYGVGGGGDGLIYRTTGAIGASGSGCATATDGGTPQPCSVTLTVNAPNWENLGGTITVKDGTPDYKVRVKFDISAALGLYNGPSGKEIYPEQPAVSISLIPQ